MKTASVVSSASRSAGGLYESVRALNQALYRLPDTAVEVLAVAGEFDDDDLAGWSPVKIATHKCVGPRFFSYAPALKRALFEGNFDILQSHGIWQYPSAAVINWHARTRNPYLISPHGMLDPWAVRNSAWKKRLALAFYERQHLERAACIRTLSESEAQAIRAFGLKKTVAIIPNGIDLPVEAVGAARREEERSEQPGSAISCLRSSGRRFLLYLGRIHPKKGLVHLLRAWATCHSSFATRHPEWMLVIAGWEEGAHEAELKRLATELGIVWADLREQNAEGSTQSANPSSVLSPPVSVVFLGPQFGTAKAACYHDCDAFILPSFSEGLPMVVLEAWAHGRPVLMTPECNLPEGFAAKAAIRIAQSAELGRGTPCAPQSGNRIEDGLRELFAMNDTSRLAMGARGRTLVAERFTWPKIARDMRAVYEWVLGGGQKPDCVVSGP